MLKGMLSDLKLKEDVKTKIKNYINVIKNSELWKKGIVERQKKEKLFEELLKEDNINKLNKDILKQIFRNLWATARQSKWRDEKFDEWIDDIINKNGLDNIRNILKELLYGEKPIEKKFKNAKQLKGFGSAIISEILAFFDPEKYGIWNTKSKKALRDLDFEEVLPFIKSNNDQISGKQYKKFNLALKKIAKILEESGLKNVDLLTVDLFLYGITELGSPKSKIEVESKTHHKIEDIFEKIIKAYFLIGKHPILWGKPGTGKTYTAYQVAKNLVKDGKVEIVTMHGEMTHYDLVGFWKGKKYQKGLIAKAILDNDCKVIILDEINRGNLELALGSVFTYLDPEYSNEIIENDNKKKKGSKLNDEKEMLSRLQYVRFIGTMNPLDRALLFQLGFALRRRFPLVPFDIVKEQQGWFVDDSFTVKLDLDENTINRINNRMKDLFDLIKKEYDIEISGKLDVNIINKRNGFNLFELFESKSSSESETSSEKIIDFEGTFIIEDLLMFVVTMKALGVRNERLIWDLGIASFLLPHLDSLADYFYTDEEEFKKKLGEIKEKLDEKKLNISSQLVGNFISSRRSIMR